MTTSDTQAYFDFLRDTISPAIDRYKATVSDWDDRKTIDQGHGTYKGSCGHVVQSCRCKKAHFSVTLDVPCWECHNKGDTKEASVKEATPAWARLYATLSGAGRSNILSSLGKGVTRSVGRTPLGKGLEGAVYPTVTGGVGDTVAKVFNPYRNWTSELPRRSSYLSHPDSIVTRANVMNAYPDKFPLLYGNSGRHMVMEKLQPIPPNTLMGIRRAVQDGTELHDLVRAVRQNHLEAKRSFGGYSDRETPIRTYLGYKRQLHDLRKLPEVQSVLPLTEGKPISRNTGLFDGDGRFNMMPYTAYDFGLSTGTGGGIGTRTFERGVRAGKGVHNMMWSPTRNRMVVNDPIVNLHSSLFPDMLSGTTKSAMLKEATPAWMRRLPGLSMASKARLGLKGVNTQQLPTAKEMLDMFVPPSAVGKRGVPPNVIRRRMDSMISTSDHPGVEAFNSVLGRRRNMNALSPLEDTLRIHSSMGHSAAPPNIVEGRMGRLPAMLHGLNNRLSNQWHSPSGVVGDALYMPSRNTIMMHYAKQPDRSHTAMVRAVLGHEMGHAMQNTSASTGTALHRALAHKLLPTIAQNSQDKNMFHIVDEMGGQFIGTGLDRGTLKFPQMMAKARFPKTWDNWKAQMDPRMSDRLRDRLLSTRAHLLLNYRIPGNDMPLLERLRSLL